MPLTHRDEELLMALVHKLRVISLEQIADTWWHGLASGVTCARRRLRVLTERRLVSNQRIMARPLPSISKPLATWRPGKSMPPFGPLAWKLQRRWSNPAKQTTVFTATTRASRQFGGKNTARLKHRHQVTHDLGVTQVYLTIRADSPARALRWVGEDRLSHRRGEKVPDALLAASDRLPAEAIEFGGAYDATRLQQFHRDCQRKDLRYEIW